MHTLPRDNKLERSSSGKCLQCRVSISFLIIFTGLVTVHNRADYWKKTSPYNFSFPSNKISHGRFEAILWSLHLSNPAEDEENEKKKNTGEYDHLFKIKPLYSELVEACKTYFHPRQNLSIHECMVASKARISMK